MLSHTEAIWIQVITIIGIFLSPIFAVLITLWSQNRQQKRGAKMKLFLDLIATRDQVPVDYNYVLALNRIDVVFHGSRDILQLWHEYYDHLSSPNSEEIYRKRSHKRIELLSAMASHLGYKNLQQVSLDKYYQPHGHYQWNLNAAEIQSELLRVLKSTETLYLLGKYEDDPYTKDFNEGKISSKKLREEGGKNDDGKPK